ncbi:MAG: hypothetical protein ACRBBW_05585 [Cellvibrionaceae bacterium]
MNFIVILRVILCALLLATSAGALSAVVLIPPDVLNDYKSLVGERAPASLRDFRGNSSRREVVEVILLLQALDAGDYSHDIRLRTSPSEAQSMRLLAAGQANLLGTTSWKQSLDKFESRIRPSFTVIRSGEYQFGLYGCRGQQLGATPDLSEISVVANKEKSIVWSALQQAGFKSLDYFETSEARARMVCLARVQATVSEFPSSSNLDIRRGGFTLAPFDGVKLVVDASRHYAISTSAASSEAVTLAVNRGLKIIRRNGAVRRALLQSGLHHPKAKNWRKVVISPTQ